MQSHADAGEAGAGQPGAVQQVGACIEAVPVLLQRAQTRGECGERVGRPLVGFAGPVGGVQRLDRVRHGVHRAGDRHRPGQGHGQLDVVDDGVREDLRARPGDLLAVGRLTEDRCHLRAGVRRGQHDVWNPGAGSDRLAEPGGRPTADGDDRVGVDRLRLRECCFGHLDGGVHLCAAERARNGTAELGDDPGSEIALPWRGQHQRAGAADPVELARHLGESAGAEDDPRLVGHVLERSHVVRTVSARACGRRARRAPAPRHPCGRTPRRPSWRGARRWTGSGRRTRTASARRRSCLPA